MQNISFYLEKFKSFGMESLLVRERVSLILSQQFGITLSKEDVVVKDGTVTIKAHPLIRGEIFLKKKRFLKALEEDLGKTIVRKIR